MGVYNVHGGHNRIVPGASCYMDEVTEDRKITAGVIALLTAQGNTVYNCTDDSGRTQGQNLANIVAKCNSHTVDLDISIHQNASRVDPGDGKNKGVEVFVHSANSKAYAAAERVCRELSALGFTNRGAQVNAKLYVLRKTKAPAMLIEVGFVDDKDDVELYNKIGNDAICRAIVKGILGKEVSSGSTPVQTTTPAPTPAHTQASSAPSYQTGKVYTLLADHLRVRTGPGTGYATKAYKKLTANAKAHAYSNGTLKKGTHVTCKDVRKVGNDIWIKTPSGWMAAYYGGKKYIG